MSLATRPFTTPRPTSYAPIPKPVRGRAARRLNLPPGPRPRLPGGLLRSFQRDTPAFLLGLRDQYGDAASFFLGGELFIGLFAPSMVQEVSVTQQSSFIKGVGFERMRKVLGEGLLTNEEPIHLRHRRMMQPPFHKSHLDGYAALMSNLTINQIDEWPDAGVVHIEPEMMRLTLRIVAETLFGTDADRHSARIAHSMGIAIDRIERTMLPGLNRLDSVPLPYFQAFGSAADDLAAVAEDLIRERRAIGADSSADLLGLLLAIRDEDGSAFSDAEVRDEALTLILSGHETTANALTWAFSWLSTRPDVQQALHDEASRAPWIREQRPPSLAEAVEATVATQVIHESLRLAPPVWVAPRRALKDLAIDGIAIPKGAHVLLSQYVTHRDPKYFPDPHTWEPGRWSGTLLKDLPRGAYFPFGGGTRKCLGDQFALLEARIILLHAMHQFTVSPIDPRHPIPRAQPRATFRAHGTVPIRVQRR